MDMTELVRNFDGTPCLIPGTPPIPFPENVGGGTADAPKLHVDYRWVFTQSLVGTKESPDVKMDEKLLKGSLAKKIHEADEVEFSNAEKECLLKWVAKSMGTLVTYRVAEKLDPEKVRKAASA